MLQSLVGLIVYARDFDGALKFFRDGLGAPLALDSHGQIKAHYETMLGQTHLALFPGAPRLVPSFRVARLDVALAAVEERGIKVLLPPLDLGEGMRVAGVAGPDGAEIRLIEIP